MQRKRLIRVQSLSESAPSSRVVHTWALQPYKDAHKKPLSAHQTSSPCLILSYVICRLRRALQRLASSRNLFARMRVQPNSTFPRCYIVVKIRSTHAHALKEKDTIYRIGQAQRYRILRYSRLMIVIFYALLTSSYFQSLLF